MWIRSLRNRLFVLFVLLGLLTGAGSGALGAKPIVSCDPTPGWRWCWWQYETTTCPDMWSACQNHCSYFEGVAEFVCDQPGDTCSGYCWCNEQWNKESDASAEPLGQSTHPW
jgi:hypothetical protein